ncbi:MAG: carboxymuconolactone decarboxylase family protein [Chloroflexota bacterium]
MAEAPESEAYRQGAARRARIVGGGAKGRRSLLKAVHPDLERDIVEHAWGGILARPGLDERTREFITLGILLALGREREAVTHFHGARNVGITREELGELLMHVSIYAGVPCAVTGAHILADVLQARGELEIPDGPE